MKVLTVDNVHNALPRGLNYLYEDGLLRNSRNGQVLVSPVPVSTVYLSPLQRVVFYPERDYNIFFNIYESLWMLAGRNDVEPLTRYVKDFARYANHGIVHGAYGYRWRKAFGMDQLEVIAKRLRDNPEDRRSVLQMWDASLDLKSHDEIKDVPCNDTATLQVDANGKLNLVVFCRSNDVIWGAYFANAFHFSMLLEYMAAWTGYEVGTYTQISVNYHAYTEVMKSFGSLNGVDPYALVGSVRPTKMAFATDKSERSLMERIYLIDQDIRCVLFNADNNFTDGSKIYSPLMREAFTVLRAYHVYKNTKESYRYDYAMSILSHGDTLNDWNRAAFDWFIRRRDKWRNRQSQSPSS